MKDKGLFLSLIFLTTVSLHAGSENVGTSAGLSLRRVPMARETALGQSGFADTRGTSALLFNPANLSTLGRKSIGISHQSQAEGISSNFFGWARPWGRRGGFGIAFSNVDYGSFDQTDDVGISVGNMSPRDLTFLIGAGLRRDQLRVGTTIKLLHSKIIHSDNVVTFDVAAGFQPGRNSDFTLMVTNIVGELLYVNETEPLPRAIRLSSFHRVSDHIFLAVDGVSPRDGDPYPALGIEYRSDQSGHRGMQVRGGWNGNAARHKNGLGGFSIGGGWEGANVSLDYAWSLLGELGDLHTFTFGWKR